MALDINRIIDNKSEGKPESHMAVLDIAWVLSSDPDQITERIKADSNFSSYAIQSALSAALQGDEISPDLIIAALNHPACGPNEYHEFNRLTAKPKNVMRIVATMLNLDENSISLMHELAADRSLTAYQHAAYAIAYFKKGEYVKSQHHQAEALRKAETDTAFQSSVVDVTAPQAGMLHFYRKIDRMKSVSADVSLLHAIDRNSDVACFVENNAALSDEAHEALLSLYALMGMMFTSAGFVAYCESLYSRGLLIPAGFRLAGVAEVESDIHFTTAKWILQYMNPSAGIRAALINAPGVPPHFTDSMTPIALGGKMAEIAAQHPKLFAHNKKEPNT